MHFTFGRLPVQNLPLCFQAKEHEKNTDAQKAPTTQKPTHQKKALDNPKTPTEQRTEVNPPHPPCTRAVYTPPVPYQQPTSTLPGLPSGSPPPEACLPPYLQGMEREDPVHGRSTTGTGVG